MSRTIDYSDLPSLAGTHLGHSQWLTVTQGMIDIFADLTDDHQWIHVDAARNSALGQSTIAHGFLTLSLLPVLTERLLTIGGVDRILNYGLDRVRFLSPLPANSRIRGAREIVSTELKPSGTLMRSRISVEAENADRPVYTAESLALVIPVGI